MDCNTVFQEGPAATRRPHPPARGVPRCSRPYIWWSLIGTPPGTVRPMGSWYRGHMSASRHVRGANPTLAQRGDARQMKSWRREEEEGEGGEEGEQRREGRWGEGREVWIVRECTAVDSKLHFCTLQSKCLPSVADKRAQLLSLHKHICHLATPLNSCHHPQAACTNYRISLTSPAPSTPLSPVPSTPHSHSPGTTGHTERPRTRLQSET